LLGPLAAGVLQACGHVAAQSPGRSARHHHVRGGPRDPQPAEDARAGAGHRRGAGRRGRSLAGPGFPAPVRASHGRFRDRRDPRRLQAVQGPVRPSAREHEERGRGPREGISLAHARAHAVLRRAGAGTQGLRARGQGHGSGPLAEAVPLMRLASKLAAAGLIASLLGSVAARAQDFPVKPIRIVASEAGGGGDFVARQIGQGLTAALGQPVIVENRGGGVIAGDAVARSAPDGYTLLLYGNTFWLLPLMRSQMPYDPWRDFVPVTLAARAVNVLVGHPSLPAHNVKELVALARARPGKLNYASAAPGTSNHL